jgi:predicted lipoprotein with Yx(FWY)xxD motif
VNRACAIGLLASAAAMVIVACGGSAGPSGESTAASALSNVGTGNAAVLTVASAPKLGGVLVESQGFTVYAFDKDKGGSSSCYGPCAHAWPPVITEAAPLSGEGVQASKLGTTTRKNGALQVTYAGHPLYSFVEDKKPGEANGNDISTFGARWHALRGNGEAVGG